MEFCLDIAKQSSKEPRNSDPHICIKIMYIQHNTCITIVGLSMYKFKNEKDINFILYISIIKSLQNIMNKHNI